VYEAHNLTVAIRGRALIKSIDLAIAPGRMVALVGPNGAGKSTLLRTLSGERGATSGRVTLHGRDLATYAPHELARWRAVLAQSVVPTFAYSAREVMTLGAPPEATASATAKLVARAAEATGTVDALDRLVNELSGGEQQRVHLARVLVQLWAQPVSGGARYLLLDEPTAHLDPAQQLLVAGLARAHAASGGGVLAVLHDLNLAADTADEVVVMSHGKIVAQGPPRSTLAPALLAKVYGVNFRAIATATDFWLTPVRPV
jgi:iron complex transport system ATP-binding protein